jgi:hypothetical protein
LELDRREREEEAKAAHDAWLMSGPGGPNDELMPDEPDTCPECGGDVDEDSKCGWRPTDARPNINAELPVCNLTDCDGNVFAIIGRVCRTLKRAGQADRADEFSAKAVSAKSYDAVLQLCFEFVDVE